MSELGKTISRATWIILVAGAFGFGVISGSEFFGFTIYPDLKEAQAEQRETGLERTCNRIRKQAVVIATLATPTADYINREAIAKTIFEFGEQEAHVDCEGRPQIKGLP